jgi:hypothetical protein
VMPKAKRTNRDWAMRSQGGLGTGEYPDLEMMREQPLAVFLKVGDLLHHEVHEEEREGQDNCGGRFHVEAGKHEGQAGRHAPAHC